MAGYLGYLPCRYDPDRNLSLVICCVEKCSLHLGSDVMLSQHLLSFLYICVHVVVCDGGALICQNQGRCINGTSCVCYPGYTGADCSRGRSHHIAL